MVDNIVPFPDQPGLAPRRSNEEREKADQARRHRLRQRAILVRDRLSDPAFRRLKPHERSLVAGRLWRLIEDARKAGVSKVDVVRQAGIDPAADNSKRLDRFQLPPDLAEDRRKRRIQALAYGAKKYVKLADAAVGLKAELHSESSADADIAIAELFADTAIASLEQKSSDDLESYATLVWLIEKMVRAVVQQQNLRAYFEDLRRVPGRLDVMTGRIYPTQNDRLINVEWLDENHENWEEAPPLPSLRIAMIPYDKAHGILFILRNPEKYPEPAEGMWSWQRYRDHNIPGSEFEEIECTLEFFREIRLSIGPVSSPEDLGPLIEERLYFHAAAQNKIYHFKMPYENDCYCIPRHNFAIVDDREVSGFLRLTEGPFKEPPNNVQDSYFWYRALSGTILLELFQLDGAYCEAPWDYIDRAEYMFHPGAIGCLERSLKSGHLEAELSQSSEALVQELNARMTQRAQALAEQHEQLVRDWEEKARKSKAEKE